MKATIYSIMCIVLSISCTKKASIKPKEVSSSSETTPIELIGQWMLIETLADPGDGSGTFTPVKSTKVICFKSGGVINSNGELCSMSTDSNNPTSGTYNLSDSSFTSANCNSSIGFGYTFSLNKDTLIVTYPCTEPCKAKYVRDLCNVMHC